MCHVTYGLPYYAYLSRILLKITNPRTTNTKFTKKFITVQTEKLFFKAAQACSDHRWLIMEISGAPSNFQAFLILLIEWVILKEWYTYYNNMAHIIFFMVYMIFHFIWDQEDLKCGNIIDNWRWYLCKASINNIFQNFFQNSFSDFFSPMNMFDPFSGASGFLGNPKITVIRMKPIVATGLIQTPEQNSPTMSLVEEDDNDTL